LSRLYRLIPLDKQLRKIEEFRELEVRGKLITLKAEEIEGLENTLVIRIGEYLDPFHLKQLTELAKSLDKHFLILPPGTEFLKLEEVEEVKDSSDERH